MSLRSALSAIVVAVFVLAGAAPVTAQPKTELHQCVPADLREDAITFKAEDGVELPGLVFGSGSSGVLLAHTQTETVCEWLPLARQLADDGHQVLLYEMRSLRLRENRHSYDLDVLGAARELDSRGVSSIIAGGAGTGAAAIAAVAEKVPGLRGMFLLTPFEGFHTSSADLDAVTGIRAVQVPSFIVAAQDDVIESKSEDVEDTRLADHARQVAGAASNARLEIVPGSARFAKLVEDGALRDQVRAFVRENRAAPTFLERWLMPIAGGVVLLVLAVVVVLRRRSRRSTTVAEVSAGS
ncbi:hypothetical protein ACIA8G_39175 [Lentzea sp. NPDC051213]|uniref:hypothetical protein n=1 Tax=Lentzea sp. NPDC051213 TaxID=3364126 RepID=UPI0037AF6A72